MLYFGLVGPNGVINVLTAVRCLEYFWKIFMLCRSSVQYDMLQKIECSINK